MLWKKSRKDASASEEGAAENGALDTSAFLLRSFGEQGIELEHLDAEELKTRCDRWARHILLGTSPHADGREDPVEGAGRDWSGVQRFFQESRSNETQQVAAALGDFRDLIWAFVRGIGTAVGGDRKNEQVMENQLDRLREAVQGNSTRQLREVAEDSVRLISRLIDERRDRYHEQLEELGSKLETMHGQLADARKRMTLDSLTRLYNRAAFDEHIERVVDLSAFLMKPAFLMMLDVDHFKWVNDNHGHQTGDEVLRQIASCIQDSFKRRDDFVARYGGEEFTVVIQETTDPIAESLAERILDTVRDLEIPVGDEKLRVTLSLGIAKLHAGEDAMQWVERADRALYEAKLGGRDRQVRAPDPTP